MRISRLTITTLIAAASSTALFAMPMRGAMRTETDTVDNRVERIVSAELAYAPEMDKNQTLSPNGTTIAFDSWRDGDGEIYTMKADGSSPVRLTHVAGFDSQPVWSPDGTRIAFISQRDGNDEIYVMDAEGSNSGPAGMPVGSRLPGRRSVRARGVPADWSTR